MGPDWFKTLMRFRENSYKDTQSKLAIEGGRLICHPDLKFDPGAQCRP